eukprot:EG_transcript_41408
MALTPFTIAAAAAKRRRVGAAPQPAVSSSPTAPCQGGVEGSAEGTDCRPDVALLHSEVGDAGCHSVPAVLAALHAAGCSLAVASQSPTPETARLLLRLWGLAAFLPADLHTIQRGSKERHLRELQARTGV